MTNEKDFLKSLEYKKIQEDLNATAQKKVDMYIAAIKEEILQKRIDKIYKMKIGFIVFVVILILYCIILYFT